MQETPVAYLALRDSLEEGMTTNSSTSAWRIPWTGEPHALQSMESPKSQTRLSNWHTHHYTLWWTNSKSFLIKPGTSQGCTVTSLFNIVPEVLASTMRQQGNKRYTEWEGRNETIFVHRWHDHLYIKSDRIYKRPARTNMQL